LLPNGRRWTRKGWTTEGGEPWKTGSVVVTDLRVVHVKVNGFSCSGDQSRDLQLEKRVERGAGETTGDVEDGEIADFRRRRGLTVLAPPRAERRRRGLPRRDESGEIVDHPGVSVDAEKASVAP
jgi:hypothetical protein